MSFQLKCISIVSAALYYGHKTDDGKDCEFSNLGDINNYKTKNDIMSVVPKTLENLLLEI